MSALDRFDRRFADALDDLAAPATPDYFEQVLERAVSRRQRPAWTFPERWLPVNVLTQRPTFAPTVPWRTIGLLILLALLLTALTAVGVGTLLNRTAPAYGPAANGVMLYSQGGDIHVRDLNGQERPLITGPQTDVAPWFSRDGSRFLFIREASQEPPLVEVMVANADGSDVRTLVPPEPAPGWHWSEWSPDSRYLALQNEGEGVPALSVINVEGEPVRREISVPVKPEGVEWLPGRDELIFRGVGEPSMANAAIYTVRADGSEFRRLTETGNLNTALPPFSFTGDGRLVSYASWKGGALQVRLLDLESGEDRVLPGGPHQGGAVISPAGDQLAFIRYTQETSLTVSAQAFVTSIDAQADEARPIGPTVRGPSGTGVLRIQFSPDARSVVIASDEGQAWLASLEDGSHELLPWELQDPTTTWQRRAP